MRPPFVLVVEVLLLCQMVSMIFIRKSIPSSTNFFMEMEMDSHGGLEVTIRQTEWEKKTTQQLRGTDL